MWLHSHCSEQCGDAKVVAPNSLVSSVLESLVIFAMPAVDVSVVHAPPRANSPLPLSVVEVDSPTAHHAPSSPDENVTANAGTQIHHEEEDANHSAAAVALTALDAAAEAALDGAALELDDLDLL